MTLFAAILENWITEFDLQALRDIMLEFLAVIAFIFLLVVVIISMKKAPMLIKHGSIEMFTFVILGIIHASMNLFDEFAWFTQEFYNIWKIIKDITLLLGAVILVVGFFRFFVFSARLFGYTESAKSTTTTTEVTEEWLEE